MNMVSLAKTRRLAHTREKGKFPTHFSCSCDSQASWKWIPGLGFGLTSAVKGHHCIGMSLLTSSCLFAFIVEFIPRMPLGLKDLLMYRSKCYEQYKEELLLVKRSQLGVPFFF